MNTQQKWIEAASHLAERLQSKQVDKAGADYFKGHLSFVASLGKTWQEKVVLLARCRRGYLSYRGTSHTAARARSQFINGLS